MKILNFMGEKHVMLTKDEKPEDIQCPACGYYCNGKGGLGCIDKPSLIKPPQKVGG